MRINFTRAASSVILAGLLGLQTMPAFAQFTGTGAQMTSWVVLLLTPIVPLAVAAVGFMCFTGRVNWAWFMGAIVGCALFFGRDQVVSLIRSWVGA